MRISALLLMLLAVPALSGCGAFLVGSAVVGTAKIATKVAVAPVVIGAKATKAIINAGKDDESDD